MELKKLKFEQIEDWLSELAQNDLAIELPHIPFTYHELYGELVRREQEEEYEKFLFREQ